MAIEITGSVGPSRSSRGVTNKPFAQGYYNEALISDFMPDLAAATLEGMCFTLTLAATTTNSAAGQLMGAAAAASTQFGLINPPASGKNYILTKFGTGIISGTPSGGPLFHGQLAISTLTAGTPGGTIRTNILGSTATSSAVAWASAAGSALTGCTAQPAVFRPSDFTTTATAQASPGVVKAIEVIDGDIIIPPGMMWLPLWSAAGTNLLNAFSVSWVETPVIGS